MFEYADKPLSIGKVLDHGLRLCASSFASVVGLAFLASIVYSLPSLILPQPQPGEIIHPLQALGDFFLPFMLSMLVGLGFFNALILRVDASAKQQNLPLGTALSSGFKKLLPVFIGVLLYMLVVILGLILLIIPGLILMLSLFFYQILIVLDNNGILESLKNSHRLVWGNWWRTATVFMIPGIFIIVIYVILGFIFATSAPLTNADESTASIQLTFTLISLLINTLTMPLFYSIGLVQLHDLKLRKQGLDLAQRLGSA